MIYERHNLLRIISNYVRLATNFFLGLAFVPLMLKFGADVFGVVALFGATLGYGRILQEIVQRAMLPELARAWHSKHPDQFIECYQTVLFLSGWLSLIICFFSLIIMRLAPLIFNLPNSLHESASLFALSTGFSIAVLTFVSPVFNLYLIQEKFVWYNFWIVMRRSSSIIAALFVFLIGPTTQDKALSLFSVFYFVCIFVFSLIPWVLETVKLKLPKRFTPNSWGSLREIIHLAKWNFLSQGSLSVFPVYSSFFINIHLGVKWNALFSIAYQLAGYIRMVGIGIADGIEAISAKFKASKNKSDLNQLVRSITVMHGFVLFPACFFVFVFADELLFYWVGQQLNQNEMNLVLTGWVLRFFSFGSLFQGLGDGWIKILYGMGEIKSYAIGLFSIAILHLGFTSFGFMIESENISFSIPAVSLCILFFFFFLQYLPTILKKFTNTPIQEIYLQFKVPFLYSFTFCTVGYFWKLFQNGPWPLLGTIFLLLFSSFIFSLRASSGDTP